MAKQNYREEIDRINKKMNIKVACMKRELKFWQIGVYRVYRNLR